jgi:NAD-dependent SIR2 family protein deacetylase
MNRQETNVEALGAFLAANSRVVVLTGAGVSLAAGIPTYRDEEGVWRHSEPIKHQEFLEDPVQRRRYWYRSMRGWPPVRDAQPTMAHQILAELEQAGTIDTLITQNVDRLHQRAGSERVIDLHGRLDRVRCLDCDRVHERDEVQLQMTECNGPVQSAAVTKPDGDAEMPAELEGRFTAPDCAVCGGILMPDVVFFGGTVPRLRVQDCMDAIERADAVLTIGSSLQIFSGFRFCRRAIDLGKPLAILNPGRTRADAIAQLKLEGNCQQVLQALIGNNLTANALPRNAQGRF